jgi:hypothetical protein
MKIRNLKVSNSRLTEGEYYPFKILKTISIDHDCPMFVMQDPLGYKILMPASFYKYYGFKQGHVIQCRVDRINCNGRMFLEPLHPYYIEGNTYDFPFVKKGTRKNLLDELEYYVTVFDIYNQEWTVKLLSEKTLQSIDQRIRCRVERIKKGRLFLSAENDAPANSYLVEGHTYEFEITGERKNPEDRISYFILKDKNGLRHPLKKKYYSHYGIRIGQTIRCKASKFTSDGYYFLEPENPWYKTGEIYNFHIREYNKLEFSDGSVQNVLVVEDPHGDDIKIFIEPEMLVKFKGRDTIEGRVINVRKSRLELEII